jgi:uncharacterized membrane protein
LGQIRSYSRDTPEREKSMRRSMTAAAILGAALAAGLGLAPASEGQPQSQTSKSKTDMSKLVGDVLHQRLPGDNQNLSKSDVSSGLKEALTVATNTVTKQVGARNGYFGDAQIRIPLPGVLGDAQKRLKPFGMSGPLDDLQVRMNRAAETAAPTAQKLVVDAVRSMTIDDAVSILRGNDTAATDFLRKKTEPSLRKAFRPYVDKELASSGAMTALDGTVSKYGAGLAPKDTHGWLAEHAVTGALNGLFYYVAREEQAIRHDPVKRTTDLLKRVFGG